MTKNSVDYRLLSTSIGTLVLGLLASCSGSSGVPTLDAAALGGNGTGGGSSSVGSGGSGGGAGATASGSTGGVGGAKATGGTTGTGGATAGTIGTGGISTGGAASGGNTVAVGGSSGKGGDTAMKGTGGTTGTGGGMDGGVSNAGGTMAGGSTSTSTGAGGATGCPALPSPPTGGVAGTMITFVEDGGWCWYQDERVVVDTKAKKLVIGSLAFKSSRAGNAEATIYDLTAGTKVGPTALGKPGVDDHNTAAFAIRPDGGYAAVWAAHNLECKSYYSVYNGTAWAAQKVFDWTSLGCGSAWHVTYNNLWYLGTDLVDFVRSVDTSPNDLISKDDGTSWSYSGRLTSTPQVGYVAGYYKYWGNNKDRVDFLATQAHPRDADTSLWHGYVQGGKVYNSAGTVIDATLADKDAKNVDAYTQVFKTGTSLNGVKLEHAWNHDIVRYDDGTVAILGQARVSGTGSDSPEHVTFYGRWDGTAWKLTYLVKTGPKLYADEQDYTGLSALHPDDPHTIYVSSIYDPSDDKTKTSKREIYQGITCDNGATWKWVPVTKGSTVDNIRPVVPKWDASHTALLWMRGTYTTAQNMTMNIVGTLSGP